MIFLFFSGFPLFTCFSEELDESLTNYISDATIIFDHKEKLVFYETPAFKATLFSCIQQGHPSAQEYPFSFQIILKDGYFLSRETTASFPILWPVQYDKRGFSDRVSLPFYAPLSSHDFVLGAVVCKDEKCALQKVTIPYQLQRGRLLETGHCAYVERMVRRHPDGRSFGVLVHEISLQENVLQIHFESMRELPYLRVVKEGDFVLTPVVHKIKDEKYGYVLSVLLPDIPTSSFEFVLVDRKRGVRLVAEPETSFPSFTFGKFEETNSLVWVVFGLALVLVGAVGLRCLMERRGVSFKKYTMSDFKALLQRPGRGRRRVR